MKTIIIALALCTASVPVFAGQFVTIPEYQNDFDNAMPCKKLLKGRILWKGQRAFYIQANLLYTGQSSQLDQEFANVVDFSNDYEALTPFRKACR